jgi:hypothetical protein
MQTGVVYDIDAPDAQGEVAIVRAAADGHDVIVGYLTTVRRRSRRARS